MPSFVSVILLYLLCEHLTCYVFSQQFWGGHNIALFCTGSMLYRSLTLSQIKWNCIPLVQQFPISSCFHSLATIIILFCASRNLTISQPHVSWFKQLLPFCDRSNSLSIMSSGFIHFVANSSISFSFTVNNIPLYVYTKCKWLLCSQMCEDTQKAGDNNQNCTLPLCSVPPP